MLAVNAMIGGCDFERHMRHADAFESDPNDPEGYPYPGKKSLHDLLTTQKWDYVTIQQASPKSFKPETYHPHADRLIANSRTVLQRALRDHGPDAALTQSADAIADVIRRTQRAADTDTLRGLEGEAATHYFAAFDGMIRTQQDTFSMKIRSRRPPLDPLNALLSFLYTILAHDCETALEGIGLDPQVGFLHALRPGRPSLALDLMEEFRAILADRVALSLINLNQVTGKGFTTTESGAVVMDNDTRKTVLQTWQKKKQEMVQHPFLDEKIEIGLLPHAQALLLARHLRGDLDAYPPFLLK